MCFVNTTFNFAWLVYHRIQWENVGAVKNLPTVLDSLKKRPGVQYFRLQQLLVCELQAFIQNFNCISDMRDNNDIALVKLKMPIANTDYIRPSCVPTAALPLGIPCFASGWGTDSFGSMCHFFMTSTLGLDFVCLINWLFLFFYNKFWKLTSRYS